MLRNRNSTSHQDPRPLMGSAKFLDILAMVTSSDPWSAALQAAIDLGAPWHANITACFVPKRLRSQSAFDLDAEVIEPEIDDAYCWPERPAILENYAAEHGRHSTMWATTHTAIAPTMRKLGAWHDLAVLERDISDKARSFDILGESLLSSHMPCLVLPPRWEHTLALDTVVVGWNASNESTRALRSALPLLQRAKRVLIVNGAVRAADANQIEVSEPDPKDYLARHGVDAESYAVELTPASAGTYLLERCHNVQADLLVMGAYGHSRVREKVFGGATRHVMGHAALPVFLQH